MSRTSTKFSWLISAAAAVLVITCSSKATAATAVDAPGIQQCPAGQYIISNTNSSCSSCDGSQSICLGGGLVLPAPGWWQPRPTSAVMSRCPHVHACAGFPHSACTAPLHPQHALRQCHPFCNASAPNCPGGAAQCNGSCTEQAYIAKQCAEGYTGNLCAVCQPGWGAKNVYTCQSCASKATSVTLFAVAVVMLLCAIRFWAYLAEGENMEMAAALDSQCGNATTAAAATTQHTQHPSLPPLPCMYSQHQLSAHSSAVHAQPDGAPGATTQSKQKLQHAADQQLLPSCAPMLCSSAATTAVSRQHQRQQLQPTSASHEQHGQRRQLLPPHKAHTITVTGGRQGAQRTPALSFTTLQHGDRQDASKRLIRPSYSTATAEAIAKGRALQSEQQPTDGKDPAVRHPLMPIAGSGRVSSTFSSGSMSCFVSRISSSGSSSTDVESCQSFCSAVCEESAPVVRCTTQQACDGEHIQLQVRHAAGDRHVVHPVATVAASSRHGSSSSKGTGLLPAATAATPDSSIAVLGADRSRPSDVLRCLLLFLQFWVIFASMDVQWPAVIAKPIAALSAVLSAGHAPPVSVDCIMYAAGVQDLESRAVARTIMLFVMPFALLALLIVLDLAWWVMIRALRQKCWPHSVSKTISFQHLIQCRWRLIMLAAVFFFYPYLARTCLSLFACLPVTENSEGFGPQLYWSGYSNIQCGKGWHGKLLASVGVIGTIVVCPGIPVTLMVLLLCLSRCIATDRRVVLQLGTVYRCYKQATPDSPITGRLACAWEGFIMLQTTACVAVTVLSHEMGAYYQAVAMNCLLVLSVVAFLTVKPYRCTRLQHLMLGGAICLTVTTYIALAVFVDQGNGQTGASMAVKDAFGVLIVLGNLACMTWGSYEMMLAFDWRRMFKAVSVLTCKIRNKCQASWQFAVWFATEH